MESILEQTCQNFELVLLDDASTDGSDEFLRSYLGRPNTRLIVNDENSGSPFVQWNRGIREARGNLIWIAESDDVAENRLLEILASRFDDGDSVGLAFCASKRIDEDGTTIQTEDFPSDGIWGHDFRMNGTDAIKEHLYLGNRIVSASAVLFRKDVYELAGPAETSLRLGGDWLQWCRMLRLCDVCYVSQTLSASRIHRSTRRHSTATDGTPELESFMVRQFIRSGTTVNNSLAREAASATATSWLQSLRAGRYSGSLSRHIVMLKCLFQSDIRTAFRFAFNWPYAFVVWTVKRHLLSAHRH